MSNKTTFTYEANDGYVGGSAPQQVRIDNDEILDCVSDEDAYKLVSDTIQEDFCQKVVPQWNESEVRSLIARVRATKEKGA